MFNVLARRLAGLMAAVVVAAMLGGCAKAAVDPTMRASKSLPKPDFIIVNDFAVTPSEVKLDRGVMATAVREGGMGESSDEEVRVGHMVAEKMASSLVEELRNAGISAARAGEAGPPSKTTAIINGQFVTIDQGDQTARVWVGFGLGGSELRTHIQISQGGELVAAGDTATTASLKPGMLTSIGAGAAAGSGAAVAAGAAGTGVSEALLATVEADAKRTAKEVAKKIRKAYVDRGWLPN
jgi:hypothetical protein